LSAPDFMSIHDDAVSMAGVAAVASGTGTQTGGEEASRIAFAAVTRDFFDVLGVPPLLGRTFDEEENRPGAPDVAMLGHAYWRQQFGGGPDVLGRTVTVDGRPRTVVGVVAGGADPGRGRGAGSRPPDPALRHR